MTPERYEAYQRLADAAQALVDAYGEYRSLVEYVADVQVALSDLGHDVEDTAR